MTDEGAVVTRPAELRRTYRCLRQQERRIGDHAILPVQDDHIEAIRRWRNDQIDVLRQPRPLTEADQAAYYERVVWPSMAEARPAQVLFTLTHAGAVIGYGGLVHLSWDNQRAELSFLLDTAIASNLERVALHFRAHIALMLEVAFDDLCLHRVCTETFDIRPHIVAVLESAGFAREGRMRDHVFIAGRYRDSLVHGRLRSSESAPTVAAPGHVLVSSASRKVPLIRCVKAAAARLSPAIRVIAGDIDSDALARHVADGFYPMPAAEDASLAAIEDWCAAHKVRFIVPTRDGELRFWARHRDRLAQRGIAVAVAPEPVVERCLDKLEFARFCRARGARAIPTAAAVDELDAPRYVVKERWGAGSRALGLGLDREAALAHAARLAAPIFQPLVEGRELSADAFVSRAGDVRGVVLRWRDLVVGGESQVTTTFSDARLEAEIAEAVRALGIRGHAVLQGIVDASGDLHIIECNCRFGGASTLSVSAGLDSLYWFLLEATGQDLAAHPFVRVSGELRQVRVPEDISFRTW
jgi:RimJ/RimL family protein N-acetyltransferase/predicted ATP-grasp superfamily ATP-dependent carboligase